MAHVIAYKVTTDKIVGFIPDAVRVNDRFINSVGASLKIKAGLVSSGEIAYKWVSDTPTPVIVESTKNITIFRKSGDEVHPKQIKLHDGYMELASELTETASGPEIEGPDATNYQDAISKRFDIAQLTYAQLDTHIDNLDLTDPEAVRTFLKKLSKVVLAHIKVSDYHRG